MLSSSRADLATAFVGGIALGMSVWLVYARTALTRRKQDAHGNMIRFSPPDTLLDATATTHNSGMDAAAVRRNFVQRAVTGHCPVPIDLLVVYHTWVDEVVPSRTNCQENLHWHVCMHTLEPPMELSSKLKCTGHQTGELLACLAYSGLLSDGQCHAGAPSADAAHLGSLRHWLEVALAAFDARLALSDAATDGNVDALSDHLLSRHTCHIDAPLPSRSLPPSGKNCLHLAAKAAQPSAVRWLLRHGANVETPNFNGWRALHMAASIPGGGRSAATVALLLQSAADVHATVRDSDGTRMSR